MTRYVTDASGNITWLVTQSGIFENGRMEQNGRQSQVDAIRDRLLLLRMTFRQGQAAFAKRIGLGRTAWANYETGERRIDIDSAKAVKRATGVTLDWIYEGDLRAVPYDLVGQLDETKALIDTGEKVRLVRARTRAA